VALSAYARSGLSSLQHLLIPRGLRQSGASGEAAFTTYGTIHGMVMPIVLFPTAFLYTLSELIVPELAECMARGHRTRINYIIGRVLRGALIFSIGVMGILFFFSEELGRAIYHREDIALFLRLFAPLAPAMYMDAAVDGMLKGVGEQVASMRYNIIDALVGTLLVYTLLPRYAITGYLITIFATELLNFYLSARRLVAVTQFRLDLLRSILKPLLCIMGSISLVQLFLRISGFRLPVAGFSLIGQILLSVILYLGCLIALGSITREDLEWIKGLLF